MVTDLLAGPASEEGTCLPRAAHTRHLHSTPSADWNPSPSIACSGGWLKHRFRSPEAWVVALQHLPACSSGVTAPVRGGSVQGNRGDVPAGGVSPGPRSRE